MVSTGAGPVLSGVLENMLFSQPGLAGAASSALVSAGAGVSGFLANRPFIPPELGAATFSVLVPAGAAPGASASKPGRLPAQPTLSNKKQETRNKQRTHRRPAL